MRLAADAKPGRRHDDHLADSRYFRVGFTLESGAKQALNSPGHHFELGIIQHQLVG